MRAKSASKKPRKVKAKAKSRAKRKSTGPSRKAHADVYTVMLAIALVALIVGNVVLYLENKAYDFKMKGAPSATLSRLPVERDAAEEILVVTLSKVETLGKSGLSEQSVA